MTIAALVVSIVFGLIMIALSVRANARFRQEDKLPMQWTISRSKPLSQTVIWWAPRRVALSFAPFLAICVLLLIAIGTVTLTPRPGQEGMLLPTVILVGTVFVAAHGFHLWLVDRTLRSNGD